MSDEGDKTGALDIASMLREAAKQREWGQDCNEKLLLLLSTLQEDIGSQMADCRRNVDSIYDDVQRCQSRLTNTLNTFVLLSQTQFIESRCEQEDDDTESEGSNSQKDAKSVISVTEEHDRGTDGYQRLYLDLVALATAALEQRTIPLYDSDSDSSGDDSTPDSPSPHDVPQQELAEAQDEAEIDEEQALRTLTFKDRYAKRPLLPLIGSDIFMNDPCIGLGAAIGGSGGDSASSVVSGASDTDSDAEPILPSREPILQAPISVPSSVAPASPSAPAAPPFAMPAPPPVAPVAAPLNKKIQLFTLRQEESDDEDAAPVKPITSAAAPASPTSSAPRPEGREVPIKTVPPKPAAKFIPVFASDSESEAEPAAQPKKPPALHKKNPAPQRLFDADEDDSDDAVAIAHRPAVKSAKTSTLGRVFETTDTEDDSAPVRGAPSKVPPKATPYKHAMKKVSDDSGSDSEVPASSKQVPRNVKSITSKKVPASYDTETGSETDTSPPLPSKVPSKVASKKAAVSSNLFQAPGATDTETETETEPPAPKHTAASKASPQQAIKRPVPRPAAFASDTDDTDASVTRAVPAQSSSSPTKMPPKVAGIPPKRLPVLDSDSETESEVSAAAVQPAKILAQPTKKVNVATREKDTPPTKKQPGPVAQPKQPAESQTTDTETATSEAPTPRPVSKVKMIIPQVSRKMSSVVAAPDNDTDTATDTSAAVPTATAPPVAAGNAPKLPPKRVVRSSDEEDAAPPTASKIPSKKLILKKLPAMPKRTPTATSGSIATDSDATSTGGVARKLPAFAPKKVPVARSSVLVSSDEDSAAPPVKRAPSVPRKAVMPRPKPVGKSVLTDSD